MIPVSYLILYDIALQKATAILLQKKTNICEKILHRFSLQNVKILLQNPTVITKCDAYSQMRLYSVLLNQLQGKPITYSLYGIEFNCLMNHKRRNSDHEQYSEAYSEPIQTLLLTIFLEISILDI